MNNNRFKFKHSLGQNFIIDEFLLEDIVNESNINNDDFVLEIGSGNGALTKCLCEKSKYVISIEIDTTLSSLLKNNLKNYSNVSLIFDDFLFIDFNDVLSNFEKNGFDKNANHIKVVANLPYYITSPIINKILMNPYISEMTIMVQKEVADRITAIPNNKDYGILTLSCNYFANTELTFLVSKNCFFPVPKVDSAVVHFVKHKKYLYSPDINNYDFENDSFYKNLFSVIKASFSQRRKKLINSLVNTGLFNKNDILNAFSILNFNEMVRAENLSLNDYISLTNLLYKN